MHAGRLREEVQFERHDDVPDGYGNTTSGWTAWPNGSTVFRADIRERPGQEKIDAGAVASHSIATVRLRKTPLSEQITTTDRAVFRGKTWNIEAITQIDRPGRVIEMTCRAGGAT